MLTRSQKLVVDSLLNLSKTNTMNIAYLYYVTHVNNIKENSIITVCLTNEQLNKIKHKRIMIYINNNYDTAELLKHEIVLYNDNLKNKINEKYLYIID